jgi:hypothetical protein
MFTELKKIRIVALVYKLKRRPPVPGGAEKGDKDVDRAGT